MRFYKALGDIIKKAQGAVTIDKGEIDIGEEVLALKRIYRQQKQWIESIEADRKLAYERGRHDAFAGKDEPPKEGIEHEK